jgi:pimeloyl-ACP methyl ester carboxylesterase
LPYFQAPAGRIYYEQHGESGPAVILLHGLASSGRSWVRLIRALKTDYRVFSLDLPGHGQSDHFKRYSFDEFVELLQDGMTHCGISKASLIGVSLGSSVALTFAIRYPEKTDALVLAGPLGGYLPWWHPLGYLDWMAFTALPLALQGSVQLLGRQATAQWLNLFGVKRERSVQTLESTHRLVDIKAVRQLLWQSAHPPYVGQLHRIAAPVLLIRGANDPLPRRFVRYIQVHLPAATLVEVGESRHLVSREKPTVFNRLVTEFLSRVCRG